MPWDTKWDLGNRHTGSGTPWVFYRSRGEKTVQRPVILSDGFAPGETNVDELYEGLENGQYPFISTLRQAGFDIILLGFADRTASILDNATLATQCIQRAISEREGDAPLTVGGFSMGGLITRYALAKMERQRMDHEVSTYLSYDTPHCGAWLPLGVQALAHYVKSNWGGVGKPVLNSFSDLVNSPAARQMLRWHLETATGPSTSPTASTRTGPTSWKPWSGWATGRSGPASSASPTARTPAPGTTSPPATARWNPTDPI
ncbi:esterase/lipase family protein [Streptomyces sp. NPDC058542]|uniref:esterase/lipase family protein n=1 Tax=Streptomyces sp. NPDC058542 TaxID=3346543 RepID=UPI00364F48AD